MRNRMSLREKLKEAIKSSVQKLGFENMGRLLRLTNFVRRVIYSDKNNYYGLVCYHMNMGNIIPIDYSSKEKLSVLVKDDGCVDNILKVKRKIRIVYPSGTSWNSIGSIYDEFSDDNKFETVVLVENYEPINIIWWRLLSDHCCYSYFCR